MASSYSSLSDLVAAAKTVGRTVEHTLVLAASDGFEPLVSLLVALRARLPRNARQGLAWAALMACDDDEVWMIARAVLSHHDGAGPPLPSFLSVAEEAEDWADWASPEEHWAYAVVCYRHLLSNRQRALLAMLQREEVTHERT